MSTSPVTVADGPSDPPIGTGGPREDEAPALYPPEFVVRIDTRVEPGEPELAYGTGDSIIVERYQGKLPRNLATSI